MKIRSVHSVAFIVLLACCLIGCNSAVFDDLGRCPQGVNLQFYRQTPCERFPDYPSDIREVRVFAFDDKDVLVGEFSDRNMVLSADYSLPATLRHTGKFTFVAWGGSDLAAYDFSGFKEGVTTKREMRVALRLKENRISSAPGPLYVGLSSVSLENREDMGVYERVAFNMRELTYRIHFTIISTSAPFPVGEDFIIRIEDDNGVYDFNGQIAIGERFEYTTEAVCDAEGALKADFTLMKLEEGRNALVSLIDRTTGVTLYTADLVDDIIMFRGDAGEPPYSLECDHDFPITLKLKYEKETWTLVQATVLDWNVISRPIELEN
ncbi:FimB/Mfa2 family fimbrial subunit [Phocaeicola vulgatus]|jgi:putative lipoprotein|uniref:FimB/Mfa2 family fimbrial subunit n=1 Tax=Bacteroidaceae TaxID=815 RepID=UPI001F49262C|nr:MULTISPECIES: FimB/Mfa2 family fimbrial subunit [Bacteroidaceae]MCE8812957.1 FimB/Mfa2 family fimbrial subunit [Bacteroides thetaiotaomicron]MCE8837003.1 FimB/Mfa2 family fimbrial subunit [Phocaeicola vulgatus]MCE9205071.1 FimB/Mfa2 family fimbrial subunit [Bacteroides thetaiotaomicron]